MLSAKADPKGLLYTYQMSLEGQRFQERFMCLAQSDLNQPQDRAFTDSEQ